MLLFVFSCAIYVVFKFLAFVCFEVVFGPVGFDSLFAIGILVVVCWG